MHFGVCAYRIQFIHKIFTIPEEIEFIVKGGENSSFYYEMERDIVRFIGEKCASYISEAGIKEEK